MAITFRVGNYIDPSGFGLAVVDIPAIEPERNISLIDYSHKWEENVSSSDSSVLGSYIDTAGKLPLTTVSEFLITNIATTSTNDRTKKAPLYYRHNLRFFHFSYGQSPAKQIYITDQDENIISNLNFMVVPERISESVYKIYVLTDFNNTKFTQYKVKYNRCGIDGSSPFPGWVETLNAEPLFNYGSPLASPFLYSLIGPDLQGFYEPVVSPVPTMSQLINGIGLSFENSPTILAVDINHNLSAYAPGVVVKYTLRAVSPNTFSVKRDYNRNGVLKNNYLQSSTYINDEATTDSAWGASEHPFTIGTEITALPGTKFTVHGDKYLIAGDQAYFTASRSFYYLKPTAYRSIYLSKPLNVVPTDDWFIRIKNGRFRRRMDSNGNAVASGTVSSVLYEYSIPEYQYQMWDLVYGPPYKHSLDERAEIKDRQTIQLKRTPMFIDPSSVLNDPLYPGFPPSGYLQVRVNDNTVAPDGILDWDVYNGTIKMAQFLTQRDDVKVDYMYEEEFFEYTGFVGSVTSGDVDAPYEWIPLDMNPTPSHSYGMYASGVVNNIYIRPAAIIDDGPGGYGEPTIINNDVLFHSVVGTPQNELVNGGFEIWNSLNNILIDGGFEEWNIPGTSLNHWILSGTGASVSKEPGLAKKGAFSSKLTSVGANGANLTQTLTTSGNKTFVVGGWVYSYNQYPLKRLFIYDGYTWVASNSHTGNGWEFLTSVMTTSVSSTYVQFSATINNTGNGDVSYIDSLEAYQMVAPDGWVDRTFGSGNLQWRSEDAMIGVYSVVCKSGSGDPRSIRQGNLSVTSGKYYTVTGWAKSLSGNRSVSIALCDIGSTNSASVTSSWKLFNWTVHYTNSTRTNGYFDIGSGLVSGDIIMYDGLTLTEGLNTSIEPQSIPSVHDFLLGSVSTGPNCRITDLAVTDVRTRGGGLSKLGISKLEDVKTVQPETEFFWDVGYFDGQAVPANGVLVVKIPKTVLISNGGSFNEDEVKQKVMKHMALGQYPILEFV